MIWKGGKKIMKPQEINSSLATISEKPSCYVFENAFSLPKMLSELTNNA